MKKIVLKLSVATTLAALSLVAAQAQTTHKPTAKPAPRSTTRPAVTTPVRPASPPAAAPAQPARAEVSAHTGTSPFEVGTNALNLGIGLGNRYGYGAGLLGGSSSVSPAFSVSYERGLLPLGPGVVGAGLFVGYQGATYDFGGGNKWKYTDVIVMLRGAFHYPVTPEFDAYGGVGVGVRHAGVSTTDNSPYALGAASSTEVASGLFVGGRYFFSPSLGAFAEVGYDQSYLKAGLALRF